MADGTGEPVRSESMEATPTLDPRAAVPGAHTAASHHDLLPVLTDTTDAELEADAARISIARRLRQPRTIISIAVPLAIIAAFFAINGEQLRTVPGLVLSANPALVLLAVVVFYAGFPLRGRRWAILLRGTGLRISTKDSTEIIFLSWLVNCVVPAKLGDVYRAYLLKINSTASLSRTFGTVFIERILDLFAIALIGLAAGYWSFRSGLPPAIQVVFLIGIVVVGVLAVGLFTMRNFGRRIIVALPLPHIVRDLYERFEEGVFGALVVRQPADPRFPHRPDLDDRGIAALPGRAGARIRRCVAGPLRGGVRRVDRIAVDRRAPQPRRLRRRRGRGHRRPSLRVWRAVARGDRHRTARSRHQRLLDHLLRLDPLRRFAPAARRGSHRGTGRIARPDDHGSLSGTRPLNGAGERPHTGRYRSVTHPQRVPRWLCCIRAGALGVPWSWRASLGSPRRTVVDLTRLDRSARAQFEPTGTNGGYRQVPDFRIIDRIEAPNERDPAARGQAPRSAQASMTSQNGRAFNEWLRAQLKAKKMSQRQLAQQSGVDHSTISRLIRGDRMPSLGTATKLARGLRELRDDADTPQYLGLVASGSANPTARVEYALRADELLSEPQVRQVMEYYLAVRMRRYGRTFPSGATGSGSGSSEHGPDRSMTSSNVGGRPMTGGGASSVGGIGSSTSGGGSATAVSTVRSVTRGTGREGRY